MRNEPQPRIQLEAGFDETWPGASALAAECVLNLAVLHDQFTAFGETLLRQYGIPSPAAFNVLTILHGAAEPLLPSIIAERMIVSRPTMTGLLKTLERRGLIQRAPHPSDKRMTLIAITPEGRTVVERVRPTLHRAEKRWLSCLTEAEQRMLLRIVARLQANGPTGELQSWGIVE